MLDIKSIVGILGYGEIGKAVAQFYDSPLIKDVDRDDFVGQKLDILHVCLPFIPNFEEVVGSVISQCSPQLVIIHSTIAPGVTQKLFARFGNVVHSPVRGIHPHLFEGMKTFVKYIGADNKKIGRAAASHLRSIGVKKVKVVTPSTATELGKLLDTTYYGVCIAFHAYANKLCREVGANFDDVMTTFNTTYNEGYKKLGKKNVIRPVLFAPQDNKIGGHCVVSNAEILEKNFGKEELLTSIIRHK